MEKFCTFCIEVGDESEGGYCYPAATCKGETIDKGDWIGATFTHTDPQAAISKQIEKPMPTSWIGANSTCSRLQKNKQNKKENKEKENKEEEPIARPSSLPGGLTSGDLFDICSDAGDDATDGWACWHRDKDPVDSFQLVPEQNLEAFEKAEHERHARLSLWRLQEDRLVGIISPKMQEKEKVEGAFGSEGIEGKGCVGMDGRVGIDEVMDSFGDLAKCTIQDCAAALKEKGIHRDDFLGWLRAQPEVVDFAKLGIDIADVEPAVLGG
ncbi:unnamed protein product [Prorocentrum cordatum]|uniref:Uncharacterized protein n=1 Tax=Prorocentrum cordatum TaxID=2364126 RepID=A0ABN9XHW5_9DINO|nr:unnamed protein product [Polarella glacialis]